MPPSWQAGWLLFYDTNQLAALRNGRLSPVAATDIIGAVAILARQGSYEAFCKLEAIGVLYAASR